MGLTRLVAVGLRNALKLTPRGYAEKAVRKIRSELAQFSEFEQVFDSPSGPMRMSGLGWRGSRPDISAQEPETIRWIDTYVTPSDVFWDIGANLGVYSVYAALRGAKAVYAFEPFGVTYVQLIRNIISNGVADRVVALNLALGAKLALGRLNVSSFEAGETSTFSGHEMQGIRLGKPIGVQHVLSVRADDFISWIPDAAPDHIKFDVDGAEALVFEGLLPILGRVRTLLVEIEADFHSRFEMEFLPQLHSRGLQELAIEGKASGRNRLFVRPSANAG